MVFQSYSSFPWLTVAGNIAFGMRYRRDLVEPRSGRARPPLSGAGRARRFRRRLSQSHLGRHAPARGDRPHARGRLRRPADGRAVRRARRLDARASAGGAPDHPGAETPRPSSSSPTTSRRRCSWPTGSSCSPPGPPGVCRISGRARFGAPSVRSTSADAVLSAGYGTRCSRCRDEERRRGRRSGRPERSSRGNGPFDFTGKRCCDGGEPWDRFCRGARLRPRRGRGDDPVEHGGHHGRARRLAAIAAAGATDCICDITDRAAVRRSVGSLGALESCSANNAGLEQPDADWTEATRSSRLFVRIIEINVIGTYYVTREAAQHDAAAVEHHHYRLDLVRTGAADFSAYVASKHGNIGFMRVLAKELGPRGISVNAVCPGWVRTRAALRSLDGSRPRAGSARTRMLTDPRRRRRCRA